MKHSLLIILTALMSMNLMAQDFPLDAETQKYTYMEIVVTEGSTKDQLFNKAKTWGSLHKFTIVKEDKEKGEYIAQGSFPVKYISPMPGMYHDGSVSWMMSVFAKEGKYKYVLTNFVHSSPKGNGGKLESKDPECGKFTLTAPGWATIKRDSKVKLEAIVKDLKTVMSAPESKVKSTGDDW
ncbi:MAG TPA: DUF4468 domain-containing protein [Cytophagaceae bacterium]|jgi:hypothetical protein|nr:DUF4468 domain-containing protein [Cytophagaceae bacterium]